MLTKRTALSTDSYPALEQPVPGLQKHANLSESADSSPCMKNCLLLHKKEQRLKLIDAGRAEMRNSDLSFLEKYQLSS